MTRSTLIFAGACVTLALGLAAGFGYEAVVRARVEHDFPAPGRLVDIGGRRLQLDCRGDGAPTVVLESGLDALGSLSWAAVQDPIAATTRVCSYSRAGLLWSDAAPAPFTVDGAARDLRTALERAGERAPFVLVGHSIGGLYASAFARLYPADVAGLVLVDSSHPGQVARLESATGVSMRPSAGLLTLGAALAATGITRAIAPDPAPARAPAAARRAARGYLPASLAALGAETEALPATFAATSGPPALGDRPLVVLTAASPLPAEERAAMSMTPEQDAARLAAWIELQGELARWSTASRHALVVGASHYIQFDRPDVVIRAARHVVESVRAAAEARNGAYGCVRPRA